MKDRIVHVTDRETVAAIERNDFHSPVPLDATPDGYWVPEWSLELYREKQRQQVTEAAQQAQPRCG